MDGAQADLPVGGEVGSEHQMLLTRVGDVWHAYLLVPRPDSEERVLSHLGAVETLPQLREESVPAPPVAVAPRTVAPAALAAAPTASATVTPAAATA